MGNVKENLSIAILNNDRFLENAFESQLLAKYEKPGSKVDQTKRLRMWLFFLLLTHVGSYEQEENNTKEPLQICDVYVLLNFKLRIKSSASMGRRL